MSLRVYEKYSPQYFFYKEQHENQTLDYVKKKKEQYNLLRNKRMTIKKVLQMMDLVVDPSDPDVLFENSIHAYQTAERIRREYPDNKELQIVGLIHDLGKILCLFDEPNWSIVGDTFVLGCKFPKTIVYYETLSKNPDFWKYDKLGIYDKHCGLENLFISFGHDEYLYQVLKQNNNHKLSEKYMDVIRYHSFYPWHTDGEYRQFMIEKDIETLKDVLQFNEFDLYSKEDDTIISSDIKLYYDKLLDEYFCGELWW